MAVVGNFNFFLRLKWKFLNLESEHRDSIRWPNNKIIDFIGEVESVKHKKKRPASTGTPNSSHLCIQLNTFYFGQKIICIYRCIQKTKNWRDIQAFNRFKLQSISNMWCYNQLYTCQKLELRLLENVSFYLLTSHDVMGKTTNPINSHKSKIHPTMDSID